MTDADWTTDDEDLLSFLIVEDSRTQALSLQMMLQEYGHQAATASNGREALERLESDEFSVVITDWIMPELDGYELCRRIRSRDFGSYIYVILVTSRNDKKDIVTGIKAGADDYLIKPVDPPELFARLNTARRILGMERALKRKNEEITYLSITDPLTRTYNRRYLRDQLPLETKRAVRYSRPVSVLICDIDHFKDVNDQYGHHTGDAVLKIFAERLQHTFRQGLDWIARYGGEEFAIVLPETNRKGARETAERLRERIAETPFATGGHSIRVTSSFGCASYVPHGETPSGDVLLALADKCLYRAKNAGRNRTVAEEL